MTLPKLLLCPRLLTDWHISKAWMQQMTMMVCIHCRVSSTPRRINALFPHLWSSTAPLLPCKFQSFGERMLSPFLIVVCYLLLLTWISFFWLHLCMGLPCRRRQANPQTERNLANFISYTLGTLLWGKAGNLSLFGRLWQARTCSVM